MGGWRLAVTKDRVESVVQSVCVCWRPRYLPGDSIAIDPKQAGGADEGGCDWLNRRFIASRFAEAVSCVRTH